MYLNIKRTFRAIVFDHLAFYFVALSLPSPSCFRKVPIIYDPEKFDFTKVVVALFYTFPAEECRNRAALRDGYEAW